MWRWLDMRNETVEFGHWHTACFMHPTQKNFVSISGISTQSGKVAESSIFHISTSKCFRKKIRDWKLCHFWMKGISGDQIWVNLHSPEQQFISLTFTEVLESWEASIKIIFISCLRQSSRRLCGWQNGTQSILMQKNKQTQINIVKCHSMILLFLNTFF